MTTETEKNSGAASHADIPQTLTHANLRQFTGSTTWYRHPLNKKALYTDGAQYVAEHGGWIGCWTKSRAPS